eukprot:SAG25_NODE_1826_length_2288_cov_1.428049_5_plen_35_part_01
MVIAGPAARARGGAHIPHAPIRTTGQAPKSILDPR